MPSSVAMDEFIHYHCHVVVSCHVGHTQHLLPVPLLRSIRYYQTCYHSRPTRTHMLRRVTDDHAEVQRSLR